MINQDFLDKYEPILQQIERPSRYIGDEFGSYNKDFNKASAKFLFAFPDKYEIGISNFGHKIIYDLINKKNNLLCDRIYAPDKDFIELLEKNNLPLYSLEAKKEPKEFDVIGFGLQYEMCYTTVLKMLELSDIPIFSKDRDNSFPLILAGGPCTSNPSVVKDFFDVFIIGDGEEVNIEVLEKYTSLKEKLPREEIIKELVKIKGVYSPLVHNKAQKRIADLTYENHPTISPIPHFTSVQDRAVIEIRRGCGRLCRFCQASHINLPIRERKKDDIVKLTKEYVKNTGYDEYSLLSLSSNDHRNIEDILKELNCHFKGTGINVSLPSQRADKFSSELAKLASGEKKATITIAPEAGTQKMRDVINKNLTTEQILNATISCIKNGWNRIKYYFVIGLPFEEKKDLEGIVDLILKINENCRIEGLKYPQITCSISIFVPKPHTPFQWARQNTIEEIQEKIKYILDYKDKMKLKNARLNFHNPKMSILESFFTRGDKRLNKFIYELHKNNAYLESWDENLDLDLYKKISEKLNIDIAKEASKEFSINETLSWDNISYGIDKSWLLKEYQKAKEVKTTTPCDSKCSNCGVCSNLKTRKILDI
ncbi:MAG: radical SAM protein [Candidatus Gastranaerophilales bacterium]|nr:radical SAM protein [Candidatus Gastranaerophilales bacterium]